MDFVKRQLALEPGLPPVFFSMHRGRNRRGDDEDERRGWEGSRNRRRDREDDDGGNGNGGSDRTPNWVKALGTLGVLIGIVIGFQETFVRPSFKHDAQEEAIRTFHEMMEPIKSARDDQIEQIRKQVDRVVDSDREVFETLRALAMQIATLNDRLERKEKEDRNK